jgi:putative transposase
MERKGYSEQPIIAILKEHEAGVKTADQYRKHGVRGELLQLESQAWWA